VSLPAGRYSEREVRQRFFETALAHLATLPGVTHAALMTQLPGLGAGSRRLELEHATADLPADRQAVPTLVASTDYFQMFELPIVHGRTFEVADGAAGREAAVVTRAFARQFFGDDSPLGRRIRFNAERDPGPWLTIVGVSRDLVQTRRSGQEAVGPQPIVFVPPRQEDVSTLLMAVRTAGDASRVGPPLRQAIQVMDPDLALYDVGTFQAAVQQSRLFHRVFAVIFGIFGASALLMAAVGLYAVMAQAATRRTREIGIRMALGATRGRVLATIMRRGVVQLAIGLALGLALASVTAGVMRTLLFGVAPRDPAAFTSAAAVLVAVGLLACWLPAWRAAKLAPVQALSHDERV
jgi:predicted permease